VLQSTAVQPRHEWRRLFRTYSWCGSGVVLGRALELATGGGAVGFAGGGGASTSPPSSMLRSAAGVSQAGAFRLRFAFQTRFKRFI